MSHKHQHNTIVHHHHHEPVHHGGGTRIAYFDCFAGASGDMLLGALLDAGLELEALKEALAALDLDGYELETERRHSHGLTGTKLHVRDTGHTQPARHLHDIRHLIESSSLPERVKKRSIAVIERLGRAEAQVHGVPLAEVHFHEIGAVDTIVDVVGFVAGLDILEIGRIYSSPLPLGSGAIQTAHGRLPAPAPATLALIASAGAPTVPHPAQTEIVTPTGAALLTQLAVFERPAMRVQRVGYGFGSKEFPWANGLRVWIGEHEEPPWERDQVVEIECNLDDVSGEILGYTMERLFAAGALDVWFTPIQMKKNRPGVLLSLLAPRARMDDLVWALMRETSTLGVRLFPPAHRLKAERRTRKVETPWGKVRVKEKWAGDELLAVSPEYEDCARLAREAGVPLVRVMEAARQAGEQ